MLAKGPTVRERFPAIPAAVGAFSRVDTIVYLLAASGAEGLAALVTNKTSLCGVGEMVVPMVHQRAPVWELLVTVLTVH